MGLKQVIVMRKDLNMRKGKMIAQGAHAAVMSLTQLMHFENDTLMINNASKELVAWLMTGMTKIVVSVNSEHELMELYHKANRAFLPVSLVKDAGKTEFKEPTYTCLAIGPAESEEIDKLTGELPLL